MMKTIQRKWIAWILCLSLLLSGIPLLAAAEETVDLTALYKDRDVNSDWDPAEAAVIDLSTLTEDSLTLSAKGDYVLSGTWTGQVVVDAPEEKVRLILNGVSITSPQGPAIYEKSADKLIITLAEGTENLLTDGAAVTDGDDTIGAALYAEDDLSINGDGSLTVNGTAKHGIQSKADLIIAGGSLTVSAVTDGIRARNSLLVLDGDITVTAGGDGLATTRTDKEDKGWILLAGGRLTVKTGSGAGSTGTGNGKNSNGRGMGWSSSGKNFNNRANGNMGRGGRGPMGAAPESQSGDPGQLPPQGADPGQTPPQGMNPGQFPAQDPSAPDAFSSPTVSSNSAASSSGNDLSQKGVKAATTLTVLGGEYSLDCADDALHGVQVTVSGGSFTICSGDDALHADETAAVSGGTLEISRCYEGIEGTDVVISGGDIRITASDDGVNAAGGADGSGFGGWDRMGGHTVSGNLTVTGGSLTVNAGGDALDSNGNITVTGGVICLWAVTSTGEGPIDFNGTGTLSGGTLLVASTEGAMADSGQLSGQSIMAVSTGTQSAGASLTLQAGSGQVLASFTPAGSYSKVTVSSDRLAEGSSCTLLAGSSSLYSGAMQNNQNTAGYGWNTNRRGR